MLNANKLSELRCVIYTQRELAEKMPEMHPRNGLDYQDDDTGFPSYITKDLSEDNELLAML